jgi:hypothetical protein
VWHIVYHLTDATDRLRRCGQGSIGRGTLQSAMGRLEKLVLEAASWGVDLVNPDYLQTYHLEAILKECPCTNSCSCGVSMTASVPLPTIRPSGDVPSSGGS